MLLIDCPWCGSRDQTEFSYHGEAHIIRPQNAHQMSDQQWGEYLFFRNNPKGIHHERWVHIHGCRRWFNAIRDTSTEQIHATYHPSASPPELKYWKYRATST